MRDELRGARRGVAAALAACCSAGWGVELTEQEAVARALSRPAYVEVDAGRVAAARSAVVEAGRLPNPVLSFEHERIGPSTERSIGVVQTFDVFGRRSLRVGAAEQRLEAARYEALDRRLQVTAEVRRGFAESLSLERQRQALGAWVDRIQAASETVGRLAKSGEVAGYARRRIEREAQSARARLAAASGDAVRSKERLRGLIGLESAEELRLAGGLMPPEPPPLAAALDGIRQRPDLAALLAQAEAYDRERMAAERAWAPDLNVGIGQKRADEPLRSDTGLMVSLAFALPLFDRGEGRRDIAAAQARALRGEHKLLVTRREADIRGLWQQAAELRAGAIALRGAPMGDLSRTAETAYRAGESSILELLDAYRAELDAELAALDLELRARLARIELDVFSGANRGN